MNKYLEEIVKFKLLKYNDKKLTKEDFEKVDELGINNKTFSRKMKNIKLKELLNFPNLKILTLQYFDISEKEMKILESLEKLNYLKLCSCNLNFDNFYKLDSLDTLCIECSEIKDLSKIEMPQNVRFDSINNTFDLNELSNVEKIKELYLNNIASILGIEKINEMKNLQLLNLDGSKVNNQNIINEFKDKIEVSQKDRYLPVDNFRYQKK